MTIWLIICELHWHIDGFILCHNIGINHFQPVTYLNSIDQIYCLLIWDTTLVGGKLVAHSDVVGASPVGAAQTTSSILT